MSVELSHTKIESFKTCPQMYYLNYVQKLKEDAIHSPLYFGSAIDKAIGIFLLTKKQDKTKEELEESQLNPYDTFVKAMSGMYLNGEYVSIPMSLKARYNKADFEPRLLIPEDYELINKSFDNIVEITPDNISVFVSEIHTLLRQESHELGNDELILFNYINWMSLKRKGLMILKAFEEEILPKINSISEIQKRIKLENNDGDKLIGVIDFVGDYADNGKVVFDIKTSSKRYPSTAVKDSQQLTIYAENEDCYQAGFIVMVKNLKWIEFKTCSSCKHEFVSRHKSCPECSSVFHSIFKPEVDIQVQIDTLTNEKQDEIFEEIQTVTQAIKDEQFDKNWNSCWQFGRQCQYFNYCRDGSTKGLIQLGKKE